MTNPKSPTLLRWVARKSDEEILRVIARMDEIHQAEGRGDTPRPIYDALVTEADARGLWCEACGEKPADTWTPDGSWRGCKTCANAPTHP